MDALFAGRHRWVFWLESRCLFSGAPSSASSHTALPCGTGSDKRDKAPLSVVQISLPSVFPRRSTKFQIVSMTRIGHNARSDLHTQTSFLVGRFVPSPPLGRSKVAALYVDYIVLSFVIFCTY